MTDPSRSYVDPAVHDRAEFDRIVDVLRNGGAADVDQERAWEAMRELLAGYPGCAAPFANMTMTDLMA
jgi:hypothetical protein